MSHNHTVQVLVSVGDNEMELGVDVEFTVRPGSSPSWTDPGDAPEIEYVSFYLRFPVEGSPGFFKHEPAPDWLADFLSNSDAVYQKCGEASGWGEDDGPDPDREYDRRRDDALDNQR